MTDIQCKCPHCHAEVEVNEDLESDMDHSHSIECEECGETYYLWGNQLVTGDDLHEYRCDSLASADYEERAYGRSDDY